jgi:DNA (cytosine-5)-methyltransferase 1
MIKPQLILDLNQEIIVDNFAGGGGASTGIELALGRHVDIAINHDPEAVAMHQANHPQTRHYCESVWEVDPREVEPGRKIGLLWLSPDCKHFSKAKGGKPVEKKIRGLAWVALRWAAIRQPRVIMLENVEEFITWGPLVEGPDGKMRPCPKNRGREFNAFINALRRHGYEVDWKELRASDYGTPTIRKRLFLIARCDGRPIVWPEPTHGDPKSDLTKKRNLKPWRTAAECIDWSIPCPSIFERDRPLADATCRRIAKGIMRYVVNAAEPFIVKFQQNSIGQETDKPLDTVMAGAPRFGLVTPVITEHANSSNQRSMPADEPLRTQCAQVKGGHFAVVAPVISTYYGEKSSEEVRGIDMQQPLHTQTTENRHALVNAFLTKFRTGATGSEISEPVHTITAGSGIGRPAGAGHAIGLVTSNLVKMRGDNVGQAVNDPLATISAGGTHHAEVRAFLIKYYGADQDPRLEEPLHTITTKDRYGLVTVNGEEYAITDIGLRMLQPRELFRAQGFPENYIIGDDPSQGLSLTKSAQVRMCGNSVCPPLAAALVSANLSDMAIRRVA